jgi:tricorn protease-like protein
MPQSSSYTLALSADRAGDYLALLSTATKELIIIRNPGDDKPKTGLLSKTATAFSISKNGQRIVYDSGDKLKTYDLEQAERFDFGVNISNLQSWTWYDDNHLAIVANNQLRFIDYDGQNDQIVSDRGDSVTAGALHDNDKDILFVSSGLLRTVRLTQD